MTIRKIEKAFALPEGEFFPEQADFLGTEDFAIALYPWDESGYKPEAHARAGWNEKGLHILLYAKEEKIQCVETKFNGAVCRDSCMEFFFQPFPEKDARYINVECNAAGVLHIGIGEGRKGRTHPDKAPEGMKAQTTLHNGAWYAISYTIPMAYLQEVFGEELKGGQAIRGNFYKCDETVHPHFGTWNPVVAEKPDFHRPECFGTIMIGE